MTRATVYFFGAFLPARLANKDPEEQLLHRRTPNTTIDDAPRGCLIP